MASLIFNYPWENTSLGNIKNWSPLLLSYITTILNITTPTFIIWGRDKLFIYNDAYRETLMDNNISNALGSSIQDVWADKWLSHGSLIEKHSNEIPILLESVPFYRLKNKKSQKFFYNFVCTQIGDAEGLFCTGYNQNLISGQLKNIPSCKELNKTTISGEQLHIARDELISLVSHELKTPITSLQLQIQTLRRKFYQHKAPTPEKIIKILDIAVKQIDKLVELINDLLDIGRIRSGRFDVQFNPTSLKELTDNVIMRFVAELEATHTVITQDISEDIIGNWDQSRLEQVVVNLISNAIKYAPGKPIHISAKKKNNFVIYTVKDLGPGIAKEKQSQIFKRYERLSESDEINGVGLGLYIVRKIVASHRGKISVRSKLNKGATFIIKLPIDSCEQAK